MDFTCKSYCKLVYALKSQCFFFQPFKEFLNCPEEKSVVFRHDIDRLPQNALSIAKIENELGVKTTFYFRNIPHVFNEAIIKRIIHFGHEIGYHYENLDHCKGNIDKAYDDFCRNLEKFRKLYPVKTICMHGSPLSKWDNRLLWDKYSYKDLGIIGEPYYDIDFNEVGYLTDTGRRWNGDKYSVRDKVASKYKFNFRTTQDVINNINILPDKIMFTIHPQRWTDNPFLWAKEWVVQNFKNQVKSVLVKK